VGISPDGWYVLEQYFEAETEGERREFVRPTHVGRQLQPVGPAQTGEHAAARNLLRIRERRGDRVRFEWNRRIRQTNLRAELIVRHVTGDAEARGPEDWWERWIAYNQLQVSGDKPLLRVTKEPERLYVEEQTHQPSRS